MKQREFEITIGKEGSVEVHIQGYKGRSCLEAAKLLEEIIGQIQQQRETSEFYEPDELVRLDVESRTRD